MKKSRLSLEREIIKFLKCSNIQFKESVYSFNELDFILYSRNGRGKFYLEAKEKRQPIKLQNWPKTEIPEKYLFILDDLTARKVLKVAPNSGIVVRDNTITRYYFYSVVDLFLMPKIRLNRPIRRKTYKLKGKWMIDLRNGKACRSLDEVIEKIINYQKSYDRIFQNEIQVYGNYTGESLPVGGTIRKPENWSKDFASTR